jgi:hypothetical protein
VSIATQGGLQYARQLGGTEADAQTPRSTLSQGLHHLAESEQRLVDATPFSSLLSASEFYMPQALRAGQVAKIQL